MEKLLRKVQDVPIPVIACVDGTVWGGACDLCVSCDMIVASDTSTFAITPAKIGIPYNASGISHFIRQLSLNKAREMFFTATPITAQDANNVGFVNHVAPSDELETVLEERINAYREKVYCGPDYPEGINSFLEKRTPQYKGKAKDLD